MPAAKTIVIDPASSGARRETAAPYGTRGFDFTWRQYACMPASRRRDAGCGGPAPPAGAGFVSLRLMK